MEMFEKASRLALRFLSPQGQLSVEQLWQLPLTSKPTQANLDDIAIQLDTELSKGGATKSFVKKDQRPDETTQLAFDIVRHIISVRVAEKEAAEAAASRREQKQQILGLIAQKETEALGAKSLDDLKALAASL